MNADARAPPAIRLKRRSGSRLAARKASRAAPVPKARATRIWRASPTSVERPSPGITTAAARTMRCEAEGSDTGLDYSRANRFGCPLCRAGRCTGNRVRRDRITRAGDADPGSLKGGEEESIALLRAP